MSECGLRQPRHMPEIAGGGPAPHHGEYVLYNVFGTPTVQRVQREQGEPLPAAPDGWRWRHVPAPE